MSNIMNYLRTSTMRLFGERTKKVKPTLLQSVNFSRLCSVPFLSAREGFHPKRNQARQKLSTLPTTRLEDLAGDVYFETARRHAKFKADDVRLSLIYS